METLNKELAPVASSSIYQKIALGMLKNFQKGLIKVTLPSGEQLQIGDGDGLHVDLTIKNKDFFKKVVLSGDIGFGESYVDGDWVTSDLSALLRWTIKNIENSGVISGSKTKNYFVNLLSQVNRIGHLLKRNTKEGSKNNISYHYDLSNDFYQVMLDQTMSYSSGIFLEETDSLYEAQVRKLDALCHDLDIQPGDHILEIGCGWGGFAIHAVTNFDCRITGVTISQEQYNFAVEKIKSHGLEDKIEIRLMDYRDIQGTFDKIVSIEMIEAVGHEFLPQYFETINDLLKPEGVAVIQAITSPDSRYNQFRHGVDFIQKHIFPGTLLPSIRAMHLACAKSDLHLINLRDIGLSYAKTLKIWHDKVEENKSEIRKFGMDEIFFRKWKYYLCYCEAAFAERNISDVQITFIKPNNTKYKYRDFTGDLS